MIWSTLVSGSKEILSFITSCVYQEYTKFWYLYVTIYIYTKQMFCIMFERRTEVRTIDGSIYFIFRKIAKIEFLHVSHELMENSTIMLVIFPICNCWSIWNGNGYKFIIIELFQNSGGFLTNLKMLEGWSTCSCTFNDIIITLDTSLCLIIHLLSLSVNSGYFSLFNYSPSITVCQAKLLYFRIIIF
jgi:hypothetical protein